MRIGIDARLIYYSRAGIGQYILNLVQALADVDPQDDFLLLQSFKDRTAIVTQPNFRRISLFTPCHNRFEQWILGLEIAPLRLDVLHSPDFIPPFYRNCRSVITVHDLAFLLYPHFLTRESARYYGQIDQAVRRTDHIIAVSESTKRDLIRLLGVPEDKISVIYEAAHPLYRPLNDPEGAREVRGRYGIEGDFILFVSTIEPRKNLPTLLRAFRLLLDHYKPRVKLVVAGSKGWLFDEVFSLTEELQLLEHVLFLGPVPAHDLLFLYNEARLLAHPAFYEGFGLPLLEAMACGTPVVASNVASIPEVVGDAALLIEPEDVDGLAVAMWRLMTDEALREELIAKGLRRASRFSWEKAAQETLAIYHRLGEGGG